MKQEGLTLKVCKRTIEKENLDLLRDEILMREGFIISIVYDGDKAIVEYGLR